MPFSAASSAGRFLRRFAPSRRTAAWTLLAVAGLGFACLRRPPDSIPVLMYHHLAQAPGADIWTVSTGEFRRQIAELKAAGYQTILPGDLARAYRWKFWLPRKPVIITFDDGLLSTLTEAEPVLHAAGFQAVCYLITGCIADVPAERLPYRTDACLTWAEIREMQSRRTIAFGLHSHSHTPDPARQRQEVAECRNIFQRKTGAKTRDYCYPYGGAPDALRQAVADAHYRTALVCRDEVFQWRPNVDFFRIPRVSVYGGGHEFTVTPRPQTTRGTFCAEVQNRGVPLPVLAVLRDVPTGQVWSFHPGRRLGGQPQAWVWTNLPPQLESTNLQVEIMEQNGLFHYYP